MLECGQNSWRGVLGRIGSCTLVFCLGLPLASIGQGLEELSLGTFNIRYDNPLDTLEWHERRNEVATAVRYFDVIGIQEALPNQVADLQERMPEHDSFGEGRNADGTGEACPIFWNRDRFDFLQGDVRWLSLDPTQPGSRGWDADLPRIATVVLLFDRKRQQTVRVINTHWSHVGSEARMNAAALIAGWSGWESDDSEDLVLVCGDLNAEEEQPEIQSLLELAELQDTYHTTKYRCRKSFGTFTTFLPENLANATRIDYIFYRGDVDVEWACADEVIKFGVYISDHMPYHAIFK